jgi:hypothetical protein
MGVGLTLGGVALAGPWSDPNGRINFTAPRGWNVDPPSNTATQTLVLAFDGSHDCYVIGKANSVTANSSPAAVIRTTREQIAASAWVATANAIRDFFPNNSAQLTSQSVDTSGVWPVQRAEFQSSRGTVLAAMQSRPGVDLMAFCRALDGASTAPFDALFASMGHPNDAAWQEQYAQQQAAQQPQQPAPAPAPQQ